MLGLKSWRSCVACQIACSRVGDRRLGGESGASGFAQQLRCEAGGHTKWCFNPRHHCDDVITIFKLGWNFGFKVFLKTL